MQAAQPEAMPWLSVYGWQHSPHVGFSQPFIAPVGMARHSAMRAHEALVANNALDAMHEQHGADERDTFAFLYGELDRIDTQYGGSLFRDMHSSALGHGLDGSNVPYSIGRILLTYDCVRIRLARQPGLTTAQRHDWHKQLKQLMTGLAWFVKLIYNQSLREFMTRCATKLCDGEWDASALAALLA